MEYIEKYRGCLIGGAAGDALGYPVEFMSVNAIKERFGDSGITEYVLKNGVAQISDDTQMTLFTATGILFGETRGCVKGIVGPPWSYVWFNYKDWYRTQTEKYPMSGDHFSWLDDIPELFSRRAPGNTCMSVLAAGKEGSVENGCCTLRAFIKPLQFFTLHADVLYQTLRLCSLLCKFTDGVHFAKQFRRAQILY